MNGTSLMPQKTYLAIADRFPDEDFWSIIFPDFPGVTSAAENFAAVPRQAELALASAVGDMQADGETLPPSLEDGVTPSFDNTNLHDPRILAVPFQASQ